MSVLKLAEMVIIVEEMNAMIITLPVLTVALLHASSKKVGNVQLQLHFVIHALKFAEMESVYLQALLAMIKTQLLVMVAAQHVLLKLVTIALVVHQVQEILALRNVVMEQTFIMDVMITT